MPMELRAIWSPNSYDGRRFVCGDQSGRTSAPINPHRVQTIREHSDRTGVSSGSQRRSQAYFQTGIKVGCGVMNGPKGDVRAESVQFPTADIDRRGPWVAFVPISDITSASSDCLVRASVRHSRNGIMEYRHSSLMFAARITLPHFSVSSVMSLPKSAGESASTAPPRSASRAFILGSARAALISLLSLSITSTGVFLGAPMPYHTLAS
jgi:hypothetical protein